MPMNQGMRASIVLPCHDGAEQTLTFLERISATTQAGDVEVVLVDNASTDSTASLAGLHDEFFSVLRNNVDIGVPAAWEQGVRHSRGPIVVLMVQGGLPDAGWLEQVLQPLQCDAGVGAVRFDVPGSTSPVGGTSAALAIRRTCLDTAGGVPAGDDSPLDALCRAAEQAGWSISTVDTPGSAVGLAKPGTSPAGRHTESAFGRDANAEGVLVFGMHRSGTSALTRVLNLLGLSMCRADDIMAAQPDDNERGYWESTSLAAMNDALLIHLGGTWDDPPPPDVLDGQVATLRSAGLDGVARSLFYATFARSPVAAFVWKDPRACLLGPFWDAVLDCPTVAVVMWRHPIEVASSLHRRNGMPVEAGLALWETYTRRALDAARTRAHIVLSYEDLMCRPSVVVEHLVHFLDDSGIPRGPADVAAAVGSIDHGMWHQRTDRSGETSLTASQRALLQELVDCTAPRAVPAPEPHGAPPPANARRGIIWLPSGGAGDDERIVASMRAVIERSPDLGLGVASDRLPIGADELGAICVPSASGAPDPTAPFRRSPFEATVFVTGRSLVCDDIGPVLDLLDTADIAVAPAPAGRTGSGTGAPAAMASPDPAVLALRSSPAATSVLDEWRERHEAEDIADDASVLGQVLAATAVPWRLLSPRYACWVDQPGVLDGAPVIVIGDHPPASLRRAADALAAPGTPGVVHVAGAVVVGSADRLQLVTTIDRGSPDAPAAAPVQSKAAASISNLVRSGKADGAPDPAMPDTDLDRLLVHVLGPDESCNAAVVQALQALGMAVVCGDEPASTAAAATGTPLARLGAVRAVNDHVLAQFGGHWTSPPNLTDGWESSPTLEPVVQQMRTVATSTGFPGVASTWSDLRLSLTLPLWRRALGDRPQAGVLVLEGPSATVDRLHHGYGIHPAQALALWERYTRGAARALAGLPVLVVTSDRLADAPEPVCADIAILTGRVHAAGAIERASQFLASFATAHPGDPTGTDDALPGHTALVALLRDGGGLHPVWDPPAAMAEASWTDGMLQWA